MSVKQNDSTFMEKVSIFLTGVDKNIKQANEMITGPQVRVKYEKSKLSIYEEMFGEEEFSAFRVGLYFLLFVICYIIIYIGFLYFLTPAIYTFQSKEVNIILKIIILLAALISPLGLYP